MTTLRRPAGHTVAALTSPLLLLLAPLATAAAAEAAGSGCEDRAAGSASCRRLAAISGGDEDLSLLQRNIPRHAPSASGAPCTTAGDRKKAVTFEGGGYLSHADFTGVWMGLLNELTYMGKSGGMETLMKKFGIVGGISGGAWFSLMLVYSSYFERLLYKGAAFPWLASTLYNSMYMAPILNPFKQGLGGVIPGLAECIAKLKPLLDQHIQAEVAGDPSQEPELPGIDSTNIPYFFELFAQFLTLIQNGQVGWRTVVQEMFERGARIDTQTPLGTWKYNRWAKGKVSLSITTAITPAAPDLFGNDFDLPEVTLFTTSSNRLTYKAQNNSEHSAMADTLPAKFTAVVGGGFFQDSPMPFCSASDCKYTPSYDFNGQVLNEDVQFSDFWATAFEKSAGRVPISSVAAASSAFAGGVALETEFGAMQGCAALSVWTTGAKAGTSFDEASKMRNRFFTKGINEDVASEAAEAGLQPLIDGAQEDEVGVADVLSAGATEILSILDSDITLGMESAQLEKLFEGGANNRRVAFSSPTAQDVHKMYTGFDRIRAKSGSEFLVSIAYGTIPCVTKENALFNIEGGRKVTLNVLSVETKDITIGLVKSNYSFNSMFDYGQLVGEIVNTMAQSKNRRKVQSIITDYFL